MYLLSVENGTLKVIDSSEKATGSMAGEEKRTVLVVMQTTAANLGSITTPIGTSQNLYLYSHYHMSLGILSPPCST